LEIEDDILASGGLQEATSTDVFRLLMPNFLPNENYIWVARFGKPQPVNDGNLHLGENGFSYVTGLEVSKGSWESRISCRR